MKPISAALNPEAAAFTPYDATVTLESQPPTGEEQMDVVLSTLTGAEPLCPAESFTKSVHFSESIECFEEVVSQSVAGSSCMDSALAIYVQWCCQ